MNDGAIIIDAKLDSDELLKAVQELLEKVKKFGGDAAKEFGVLDKAVESTGKKAAKLKIDPTTEGIEAAVRDLDILNAQIETQAGLLGEYQREHERLASRFGETSEQALKVQKKVLAAESAISKMTKRSDALAGAISDAEDAMKDGGKAAEELGDKSKDAGEKMEGAGKDSAAFQHALGDLIARGIEKVISALVNLSEKTLEYRQDMSKLIQNARDARVSLGTLEKAMRDLNAITGEADSNVEAVSNLLATGFKDNNLADAVNVLSGAVIKFPDTMKIESLADSLQETLATKEATGQFAELLGRVGINVDNYNRKIAHMSVTQARNYTIVQLQKAGLNDVNEAWRQNNQDLIAAANAQYDLNETYAELAVVLDPIRASILKSLNKLLTENKDTIQGVIKIVGNAINILLRVLDTASKIPTPILLIGVAIGGVVLAVGKFSAATILASFAISTSTKALAAASPAAVTAGASFAMLAVEITLVSVAIAAVAAAIAAVINSIANLITAIKSVPPLKISSSTDPALRVSGYANGTLSASRGLSWVGENGPELVDFRGGERVFNATQSLAMRAMTGGPQQTYIDNSQIIMKVDDVETFVAIKKRLQSEKQSRRMGYVFGY